jgi:hypothetical protein
MNNAVSEVTDCELNDWSSVSKKRRKALNSLVGSTQNPNGY